MTHMIEGSRGQEHAVLRSMYAARKSVFVDLLGWDVPVLDGQFEIDQFDGPQTLYLIAAEPDGTHLGSMRLLPTSGPTLLGDIFDFLCDAFELVHTVSVFPAFSAHIWTVVLICLHKFPEKQGILPRNARAFL